MKKVPPGIAGYIFLSISVVLLLGACVKPVGVNPLLKNDRGETTLDVGVEIIKDIPPVLQVNVMGTTSPLTADETVNLGGGDIITVTNEAEYDTIEWYFNSVSLLTTHQGVSDGKGETLTVNTRVAPFNVPGPYSFAVIGKKGEKRYSTLFYVNVGS